eukprot:gene11777-11922_t
MLGAARPQEHHSRKTAVNQGDPFTAAFLLPGVVRDAAACKVVWARVKGFAPWPAQVLTKAAAKQLLGGVPHKSRTDSPVIFFGTSEVAWIGFKDVFCWEGGMQQHFHTKGRKNKKFVVALEQQEGPHGDGTASESEVTDTDSLAMAAMAIAELAHSGSWDQAHTGATSALQVASDQDQQQGHYQEPVATVGDTADHLGLLHATAAGVEQQHTVAVEAKAVEVKLEPRADGVALGVFVRQQPAAAVDVGEQTCKPVPGLSRERPKRMAKDDLQVCNCRVERLQLPDGSEQLIGCGEQCLNRLSFIHCDPRTCPCGTYCSNKPFHLLKAPSLDIFLTENRGHGVRVAAPLPKNCFVVEYAGEVIDQAELSRRMDAARDSGEQHFYIMEMGPGLFIDARKKGNHARLLNSCCDPNCETQKWRDAATGEVRIGIFTRRPVAPNEELTYDYMFEHYGLSSVAQGFKCQCGAKNCRGTMDINPERKRDWGRRLEVFWEGDGVYYRGTVTGYSTTSGKHTIMYDDGDVERVQLGKVAHRWLDGDASPHSTPQPAVPPMTSGGGVPPAGPQRSSPLPLQLEPAAAAGAATTGTGESADVMQLFFVFCSVSEALQSFSVLVIVYGSLPACLWDHD